MHVSGAIRLPTFGIHGEGGSSKRMFSLTRYIPTGPRGAGSCGVIGTCASGVFVTVERGTFDALDATASDTTSTNATDSPIAQIDCLIPCVYRCGVRVICASPTSARMNPTIAHAACNPA